MHNRETVLWHFLFESLAYAVAFRLYLSARRQSGDFLDSSARWSIVAAAIGGAAIGSKILAWLEDPARTLEHWNSLAYLLSGKTIVGAILGGTIAVEITKRYLGIQRRTGDLFAVPLAAGIAVGRVGCLLAGVQDETHGLPTSLPWGMDLGDGVRRHPVEIYEIAAMLVLILILRWITPADGTKRPSALRRAEMRPSVQGRFAEGDRFRVFVLAYFGWRLLVDFLKPGIRFGGLTTLQWCCVATLIWYARDLRRMMAQDPRLRAEAANG